MPLLGYNYNKPGKGVDPNAPKKHPILMFWELLGRKFFNYMLLNIMYFIVLMPIIILIYALFYGWLATLSSYDSETFVSILFELFATLVNYVPSFLHAPAIVISILIYGPLTCGLIYIFRNYAREEHAFISDFFTKAKENWKQGLFFGILDILLITVLIVNVIYSSIVSADTFGVQLFSTIVKYLTIVLFVFYTFMRNYIYQMIVTAELSIRAILKNAWLFAILGLGRNIIVLIGTVAALFVAMFLHPMVEVICVPLIALSFINFLSVYTTYPIIEKYIIKPAKAAEEERRLMEEREIEQKLGNRGGELPPELGGAGAGAIGALDRDDDNETETETETETES